MDINLDMLPPGTRQQMIDNGYIDASGNWLIDPYTGNPLSAPTPPAVDPTVEETSPPPPAPPVVDPAPEVDPDAVVDDETGYVIDPETGQFVGEDGYYVDGDGNYTGGGPGGLTGTPDTSNEGPNVNGEGGYYNPDTGEWTPFTGYYDPNTGEWVSQPGAPDAGLNEDLLLEISNNISTLADSAYASLLEFQANQEAQAQALVDEIKLSRDIANPLPPERAGSRKLSL